MDKEILQIIDRRISEFPPVSPIKDELVCLRGEIVELLKSTLEPTDVPGMYTVKSYSKWISEVDRARKNNEN